MEYCPKCGKEVIPGNRFCGHCGSEMPNFDILADYSDPVDITAQSETPTNSKADKMLNYTLIIIIGMLCLTVVIICFMFTFLKDITNNSPVQQEMSSELASPEDGVSPIPEISETPKITVTPQVTVTPEATATPRITVTPSITPTPKVTRAPRTTSSPGKFIYETDEYSMEIPNSWKGHYTIIDGNYGFEVYNTDNEEYGGWLFTLDLYSSEVEWDIFPDYEVVTSLSGKRHVIHFPTDVQCNYSDKEASDIYRSMTEDIDEIIDSIIIYD